MLSYLTLASSPSSIELKGNYSGTPDRAVLRADGSKRIRVNSLNISVADTDTSYNKFGSLSALTNGLKLRIESLVDGEYTTVQELLNGQGLKSNLDFNAVGQLDVLNDGSDPVATRQVTCKITFTEPIEMVSTDGTERLLSVYLSDDISAIESLRISADWEFFGY